MKTKAEKVITTEVFLDIEEITLLTTEEARLVPRRILAAGDNWWLRSPGYDVRLAAYVYLDGFVLIDGYIVDNAFGVRPALRICNFSSANLNLGDKLKLAGETWTVISEDFVLCDDIIGECAFRHDYKTPDANDYEKSDVKKYLETWAKDRGLVIEPKTEGGNGNGDEN